MFNISYNITSNSSYRIILIPNWVGVAFGAQIIVKTIDFNQQYYSVNKNTFMIKNFGLE